MRLRRGRQRLPPAGARPPQTPELVGRERSSAPSSRRSRSSAHNSSRKPCASLRAAQIIATISSRFSTFHAAGQQEPSRRVRPAPTRVSRSVAQPPRIFGEASLRPSWKVPPRSGTRPRSVGAGPGRRRERCFPCARRLRRPALRLAGSAGGTPRASWPGPAKASSARCISIKEHINRAGFIATAAL
ncbi:MAG: hypothetical protein QOE70_2360 [Chthoniobacter sp.]|nr:hypothetical protein [Chthoniobacter sp.]